jgi:hypothetical protein
MSTEAYTIKTELDLLTNKQAELEKAHREIREFILSDKFVVEKNRFESLLSQFEEKAISVIEMVEMAPPVVVDAEETAQPPQQATPEMQERSIGILVRALLVAVAIIAAGILEMRDQVMTVPVPQVVNGTVTAVPTPIQTGYLPPGTLQWVAVGTILIVSMPWILDAARRLMVETRRREEMKPITVKWIHRNIEYIRNKYLGSWLLTKIQDQTKEDMPNYEMMGIDEVLYSRIKYLQATLSTEFISILGKIVVACDRSIWIRKGVLISAIVQSRMAAGRMR